ncbi:MAG: hypothetical protein IJF27_00750 [Oscillospiraceae bacterium]|nr:hypothetical protein [Oscillospiraceae bacterium]
MKIRRYNSSQPKIRRYKKIYRKTNTKVIGTAIFVVALVVVFFLSWSLYRPIIDFFSGNLSSQEESSEQSSQQSSVSSKPEVVITPPQVDDTDAIRAVYMPIDMLYDSTTLNNFLDSLNENKYNYIMLDMKTADGNLTYTSSLKEVQGTSVVMTDAISNMPDTVALLRARGFGIIAKIHVFRDPIGSRSDYDKAIHYLDSELFWLDNTKEKGGKTWLNPCSQKARDYVVSIAEEVAQMGVDIILFDDIRFPNKLGFAYADCGVEVTLENKDEYLNQFIVQATETLSSYDVELYFSSPANATVSEVTFPYGTLPVLLAKDGYAPTLYAADYNSELPSYTAVEEQLKKLAKYIDSETEPAFLPILDASKGYDDAARQISVLTQNNYNSYILYSENGNYGFAN